MRKNSWIDPLSGSTSKVNRVYSGPRTVQPTFMEICSLCVILPTNQLTCENIMPEMKVKMNVHFLKKLLLSFVTLIFTFPVSFDNCLCGKNSQDKHG